MKYQKYAVSVIEKAKDQVVEQSRKHMIAFRVGGISGVCAGIMANPVMLSFASSEGVSGGANALDSETMAVITNAFSSLGITATAIIVMAMTATVGVLMLSQACDYALKRMKAAFKKAA